MRKTLLLAFFMLVASAVGISQSSPSINLGPTNTQVKGILQTINGGTGNTTGNSQGRGNSTNYLDATLPLYAGADMGDSVMNALAAVYAVGGGVVDAQGFSCPSLNCYIGTRNLVVGDAVHPVVLLLPSGNILRTMIASTGKTAQIIYLSHSAIIGQGKTLTYIKGASDTTAVQQGVGSIAGGQTTQYVVLKGFSVSDTGTVTVGSRSIDIGGYADTNGVLFPAVSTGSTNRNVLGAGYGNQYLFNGPMAHIAIYPNALTAAQISTTYGLKSSSASVYNTNVKTTLGATNHWTLGETSGSVATDVIGGENGTYGNRVVVGSTHGINGSDYAANFPGGSNGDSTGYVTLPTAAYFPTTSWTLEGWAYITTQASNYGISNITTSGNQAGFSVEQTPSNDNFFGVTFPTSGGEYQALGGVLLAGQWNMFDFVYDGTNMYVYVNGVQTITGSDVENGIFEDLSADGAPFATPKTGTSIGVQLNGVGGCICYDHLYNVDAAGTTIGANIENSSTFVSSENASSWSGGRFSGPVGVYANGAYQFTFNNAPDFEGNSVNAAQVFGSYVKFDTPYWEGSGPFYFCGAGEVEGGGPATATFGTVGDALGCTINDTLSNTYGYGQTPRYLNVGSEGINAWFLGTPSNAPVISDIFGDGPITASTGNHAIWNMGAAVVHGGVVQTGSTTMTQLATPAAPPLVPASPGVCTSAPGTCSYPDASGATTHIYAFECIDANGVKTPPGAWTVALHEPTAGRGAVLEVQGTPFASGSGYALNDVATLTYSDGKGTGATVKVTGVDGSGHVLSVTQLTEGSGYSWQASGQGGSVIGFQKFTTTGGTGSGLVVFSQTTGLNIVSYIQIMPPVEDGCTWNPLITNSTTKLLAEFNGTGSSPVYYDTNYGTSVNTPVTVNKTGIVGTYNGVPTVGDGISYTVGNAAVAAFHTTQTGTILAAPVASHAYKVGWFMWQAASGSGGTCSTNATVSMAIGFKDPSGTVQSFSPDGAINIPPALAAGAFDSNVVPVVTASGTAISYTITWVNGNCTTQPTVQAILWVEAAN